MFMDEVELETILHFLILYSLVNNGIKAKDYDVIKKEILYVWLILDFSSIEVWLPIHFIVPLAGEGQVDDEKRKQRKL